MPMTIGKVFILFWYDKRGFIFESPQIPLLLIRRGKMMTDLKLLIFKAHLGQFLNGQTNYYCPSGILLAKLFAGNNNNIE